MQLSELIEYYKNSKFSIRASILFLMILMYVLSDAVMIYENLTNRLQLAKNEVIATSKSVKKAMEKKKKLPEMEAKLDQTLSQLSLAEEKLPQDFNIDVVLKSTTDISRNSGVVVNMFDPGEPKLSNTVFKYMELPISLNIVGGFYEIANFLDELLRIKTVVHIKNLTLNLTEKKMKESNKSKFIDDIEQQRNKRNISKLNANLNLMVYRSLTESESAKISKNLRGKAKGKK